MKKFLFGSVLLALVFAHPFPTMAEVNVGVSIGLPPLIVFSAPPEMVVIPETYVYVVPDVSEEIYFYNGWWWRPWHGHWYRSRYYDRGWAHYRRAPSFYSRVPPGWRNDYRDHRWQGHQWNYQRIPNQQVQRNWRTWEKNRHWERQQTWGVQGLKPRGGAQRAPQGAPPRSQAQPRDRGAVRPEPSRPPSRDVQPRQSGPQPREVRPPQSRPQSHEVQQPRSQPQRREGPQQSQPRPGKPGRGEDERPDRR